MHVCQPEKWQGKKHNEQLMKAEAAKLMYHIRLSIKNNGIQNKIQNSKEGVNLCIGKWG